MKIEFRVSPGFHRNQRQADALGQLMERLRSKGYRIGTTEFYDAMIQAARPKSSPTHDCWEWDEKKIIQQSLRDQAAYNCRAIFYIRVTEAGDRIATRYITVVEQPPGLHGPGVILTGPDLERNREDAQTIADQLYGMILEFLRIYDRFHDAYKVELGPLEPLAALMRKIMRGRGRRAA